MVAVLEEGKRRGLLGPAPVERQLEHGLAFATVLAAVGVVPGGRRLDLGTGGGLPGLVLASVESEGRWALLDSRRRSAAFVEEAAAALDLCERVEVVLGRAEEVGRDPAHRGSYAAVVSRGFGPPAATAECGAPFLRVPGWLVVSEPPTAEGERWPDDSVVALGLRLRRTIHVQQATFALLEQVEPCPERFPRRTGVPLKRLLWSTPLDSDVSRETKPGT